MRTFQENNVPFHFRVVANGVELHNVDALTTSSPEELWHDAAISACETFREMFGRVEPGLDWRLEVTDQFGKIINLFSFKAEVVD
jgi:hypothetical protein